jgi:C1A family cysteine protease
MSFSIDNVRLDGCIMEPAKPSAYTTRFAKRELPDQVDLRNRCTEVENQGGIGSCTANAAVGAMEYHYKCAQGWSPDLSRLFVYYNTRRLRGNLMMDTGATIPEAMAALLAYGACPEEMWPYNPMLFAAEPPPQIYQVASQHTAARYARVDKIDGSLHALAEGLPVAFGTFLPKRCYDEAASTGVIPKPTTMERQSGNAGGHAMLIVGYDRNRKQFLIRNSWGREWGDNGYGWISFDILDECSPPDQFWVVTSPVQTAHLEFIIPGGEDARTPDMRVGDMADTAERLREEIRADLESDLKKSSGKIDDLLSRTRRDR